MPSPSLPTSRQSRLRMPSWLSESDRTAIRVVVLQAAADVIRILARRNRRDRSGRAPHCSASPTSLRRRARSAPPPSLASIMRRPSREIHSAVMILMHAPTTTSSKVRAAVARFDQILGREEDVIASARIDFEPAHIERPLIDERVARSSCASARRRRRSATARPLATGSARTRDCGSLRRDGEADAPQRTRRQPVAAQFAPRCAAIDRFVDAVGGPPLVNIHGTRRNCHTPAYTTLGSRGSTAMSAMPLPGPTIQRPLPRAPAVGGTVDAARAELSTIRIAERAASHRRGSCGSIRIREIA